MATVTKKELVDRIAASRQLKRQDVKTVVQEFLNLITAELAQENRLEFRDFGVFEVKRRARRMAQNPKTLERVEVPARKSVKFKCGRLMKLAMDDPEAVLAMVLNGAGHDDDADDDSRDDARLAPKQTADGSPVTLRLRRQGAPAGRKPAVSSDGKM